MGSLPVFELGVPVLDDGGMCALITSTDITYDNEAVTIMGNFIGMIKHSPDQFRTDVLDCE